MQKVDIPIYVVRSDYSKKGVEKNIHKIVEFNQINNLSVILNGVSKSAFNNKNYYGNGYGYGYGYYNEDENKPSFLQRILKK